MVDVLVFNVTASQLVPVRDRCNAILRMFVFVTDDASVPSERSHVSCIKSHSSQYSTCRKTNASGERYHRFF